MWYELKTEELPPVACPNKTRRMLATDGQRNGSGLFNLTGNV